MLLVYERNWCNITYLQAYVGVWLESLSDKNILWFEMSKNDPTEVKMLNTFQWLKSNLTNVTLR